MGDGDGTGAGRGGGRAGGPVAVQQMLLPSGNLFVRGEFDVRKCFC